MKALIQTQTIVLKETDLGESDKLLTLFSIDAGKLQCVAKGAKRSKKRFVNKLEQFTFLDITYAPSSRSLHRLDQAEVIDYFEELRYDYHRYTAAVLASEILLHWIKENDADPDSFRLFSWTLRQLNIDANLSSTLIFFFVKLLSLQGYRPVFDRCTICATPVSVPHRYFFSARRYGVVCDNCHPEHRFATDALSPGLLKLLFHVQQLETDKLNRLRFNIDAQRQSFKLLEKYFSFLLHRDMQAWKVTEALLFSSRSR